VWATGAVAHSPIETTTPRDEATVAQVPAEVVMAFKGGIRLTRVSVTHADSPAVDLDLEGFGGFISTYAIPLLPMGSGLYLIEWRGLGDDGHAMSGSFSFTVE
jgi:methionine-rich copper-binding protein CopC